MTTPIDPDYPYCVTVTKPGYNTVHLGFEFQFHAEMAGVRLRDALRHTGHPEGTTVTSGPTPAGVHVEPLLDTSTHALAEKIQNMPDDDSPDSDFPALYTRLAAQLGADKAGKAWMAALALLDEPAETGVEEASVTAGYDPDRGEWHVEVRTPGHDMEIVRIAAPHIPSADTARALAQLIANVRSLTYVPENIGLTPPADLVKQIRVAAGMPGDDDPSLLEAIVGLRVAEERGVAGGWAVTDPARIILEARDGSAQFAAAGAMVVATPHGHVAVGPVEARQYTPDAAREIGVAYLAAAKHAEKLQAETAVPGPAVVLDSHPH